MADKKETAPAPPPVKAGDKAAPKTPDSAGSKGPKKEDAPKKEGAPIKKAAPKKKGAPKPPVEAGDKKAAPKAPGSAGRKRRKNRPRKIKRLPDGTLVTWGKRRDKDARKKKVEDKAAKVAQKRPAGDSKDGDAPAAKKIRVRRAHRFIASGVAKFSRPYKYHRRGKWICTKKVKKATPKKPRMVKKEIGGDKNGGFRMVLLKKRRQSYPTCDPIRRRRCKYVFKKHKRYIRSSLKPGTICILLAGHHRGKRVVLMKVLSSGLLLVNGPLSVNGCPLRRMSQNYVIATRTRLDLSDVKIPKHITDDYFRRIRPAKKTKKEGDDIFTTKKEKYTPSEQRKADQVAMDKAVIRAIKKFGMKQRRMKTMLLRYMSGRFGLRRNQKPHVMKF